MRDGLHVFVTRHIIVKALLRFLLLKQCPYEWPFCAVNFASGSKHVGFGHGDVYGMLGGRGGIAVAVVTGGDEKAEASDKLDEILEEKTERIEAREEAEGVKQVVQDFNWGDITIPDKF